MNYQRIYDEIINRSRDRKKLSKKDLNYIYYENHHIIPKCIGGSNEKDNLTFLTAREHYLVHWILTKIYPENRKIKFAFYRMSTTITKNRNYRISSRAYAELKTVISESLKEQWSNGQRKPWGDENGKRPKSPWSEERKKNYKNSLNEKPRKSPGKQTKEHSEKISKGISKFIKNNGFWLTGKSHPKPKGFIPWNKGGGEHTQIKCEYCDIMTDHRNYKKWHGENCKNKNRKIKEICNFCNNSFDIRIIGIHLKNCYYNSEKYTLIDENDYFTLYLDSSKKQYRLLYSKILLYLLFKSTKNSKISFIYSNIDEIKNHLNKNLSDLKNSDFKFGTKKLQDIELFAQSICCI